MSFSWNAGGLAPARWDLLQQWAEAQELDVLCVQETHWPYDSEWQTSSYHCIHSGIHGNKAGVLCLISKRLCPSHQLSWQIIDPGRFLHVRIHGEHRSIDILNLYQHVHSVSNMDQSQHVWDLLNDQLTRLPQRNFLMMMGDFNTSLPNRSTSVGAGHYLHQGRRVTGTTHTDSDLFHQLLRQHSLVVLNTWSLNHGPTYVHPNANSRIDYVCCRRWHTDQAARQVHQLHLFPLNFDANTFHIPILTSTLRCWIPCTSQTAGWSHRQRLRLYMHWRDQDETAQTLQMNIQSQLQAIPCGDQSLQQIHDTLTTFTSNTFSTPPQPRPHQFDLTPFQAFRFHGLAARRLQGTSGSNLFQAWFHIVQMQKARRAMNSTAKQARKAHLQQTYDAASEAAMAKDHFRLYQAIRKLAPKQISKRVQLRNADGTLANPVQAADMLAEWYSQIYAPEDSVTPVEATNTHPSTWPFSSQEFAMGLKQLPLMKSLAPKFAPAPFWHMCANDVATLLQTCFQDWCPKRSLPSEWKTGHLVLLPKPGRKGSQPGDLRPVALLEPTGKVTMGLVAQVLLSESWWLLRTIPQFAYLPDRGCQEAISRVLRHCGEVRQNLQTLKFKYHLASSGHSYPDLFGGLLLSLDLSRAFDEVSRPRLFHSLREIGIHSNIIELLDQIYSDTRFEFVHRGIHRTVETFRGIRQGCKAAPILWCIFSADILTQLADLLSWHFMTTCVTAYADDFCQHQTFHSMTSFCQALHNAGKLMDVLETNGLKINTDKAVVLCRFLGRHAAQVTKKYILRTKGKTFLRIPRQNGQWTLLQLVKEYTYLGVKLSYGNFERLTMQHRLAAGTRTQASLHRWLHVQPGLSFRQRLQLWRQCVFSSMTHGLLHTGFNVTDLLHFHSQCLKQIRRIYKQPVFITRESHTDFLTRLRLHGPLQLLHNLVQKTLTRASQRAQYLHDDDILHDNPVPDYAHLLRVLETAIEQTEGAKLFSQPGSTSEYQCQHCELIFSTITQLRRHHTQAHDLSSGPLRTVAPTDMTNGLPTCKRCQMNFTTWSAFRYHVQFICHQEPDRVMEPEAHDETDHEHRLRVAEFMQYSNTANFQALQDQSELLAYFQNHCILCGKFHLTPKAMMHHWTIDHADIFVRHGPALETITQLYSVTSPCALCGHRFRQRHHCMILGQAAMCTTSHCPPETRSSGTSAVLFTCDICRKAYVTRHGLRDHIIKYHDALSAKAPDQPVPDSAISEMIAQAVFRQSVTTILTDPLVLSYLGTTCALCSKTFKTKRVLMRHLRHHHATLWSTAESMANELNCQFRTFGKCFCDPEPQRTQHICTVFIQFSMLPGQMAASTATPRGWRVMPFHWDRQHWLHHNNMLLRCSSMDKLTSYMLEQTCG